MVDFLKVLTKELKKICPDVFLEYNTSKKVVYPYLTFQYQSESPKEHLEGFYVDIDIFDNCGANTVRLENLIKSIKQHFNRLYVNDKKVLILFEYKGCKVVSTQSENIKRRWIQLYIKVKEKE